MASNASGSEKSTRSSSSNKSRAKAEAARVMLQYAQKEAELRVKLAQINEKERINEARTARIKEEYDAEIDLLRVEGEAAAAEAHVSALENGDGLVGNLDLPIDSASDKSRQWINKHHVPNQKDDTKTFIDGAGYRAMCGTPSNENNEPCSAKNVLDANTDVLASFLLKKDLLPHRLQKFGGQPHTYPVWKATFKTVMSDLRVSNSEELDLLMNNLDTRSKGWAESMRASNPNNPSRASNLIWERLDECFGSPEKIEFSLKQRIDVFPVLSNKENLKLYELSDLLREVESVKADPQFSAQFAVYDSSAGVNQFVRKLPYTLQQKWISHASKYKSQHNVTFPPFSVFVRFIREMSKIRNDPAFAFEPEQRTPKPSTRGKTVINNRKTDVIDSTSHSSDKRASKQHSFRCPIHKAGHALQDCNTFKRYTLDQRRNLLREKGICFKCLASTDHRYTNCPDSVQCANCKGPHHILMHRYQVAVSSQAKPVEQVKPAGPAQGGEPEISAKCTTVCGQGFTGRSCGKIVLVDVHNQGVTERVYALLDDQSNRSLIGPELCDKLNVSGTSAEYTLSSCSGSKVMSGRRATGLAVSSTDGTTRFEMPSMVECDAIPQDTSEIPTPEVAMAFPHLQELTSLIPPFEQGCGIQILIGRDLPAAHHVQDQVIGPSDAPFAVRLPLGWVIVGEVCIGKFHRPENVNTYKTNIVKDGRGTIFKPCDAFLNIKEHGQFGTDVFQKTPDDNNVGLSAEDREFVEIMNEGVKKDITGQWSAPLPFKSSRQVLHNNRQQAFKRAVILKKSLENHPKKCEHLIAFMQKVFDSGAAEEVPDSKDEGEEHWYLPLFGVYHPKKPDKIRGVFDSSVVFRGQSLNDQLLSGPNLTNSLLGVLLRFRKDKFAISADVEQMFYRFLVHEEHRNYLRFIWFERNDPERPLTVFRMRVHVFGNRPSPAVATYGLRKATEDADPDVQQFVARDFYVDDAMMSRPTREQAVSLLKRTQHALHDNGQIHLHKVASNDTAIMSEFPKEELNSTLKDLDLDDTLPAQQSLGLTWDINSDMFVFSAPHVDRPFTRRGLLSAVNSVFDPIGFVAPFTISGKMLLRDACPEGSAWDDPLPSSYHENWTAWKASLEKLQGYQIPRMYVADSLTECPNSHVYVYSDASETAIAAAAYIVNDTLDNKQIGFVMGKAKLAPKGGHSIPRLELCAAVLATEIASFVSEQLNIGPHSFRFFSDSRVVLGYICNRTRRFYTYVSNRVAQIHGFSTPEQWNYVSTEDNPADAATRSFLVGGSKALEKWHKGPTYLVHDDQETVSADTFPLQHPEEDAEIRPDVVVKSTHVKTTHVSITRSFERFSTWKALVSAFCVLIHVARTYNRRQPKRTCSGWHICNESCSPTTVKDAERLIIAELQQEHFPAEIKALKSNAPISKNSNISALSPYLDEDGILRVGGRLRNLQTHTGLSSVNPIIIPKGYVASLLVRHHHEKTFHQGRHLTEGAIRENGLWIIGAKKLICSILHHCVICRKLRGPLLQQKMADLPADRLSPGPPFSAVGVDVFGPWEVVTRKTRGGAANSKRWAVMFTCLTTRAAHIEVIEDMSSSCFINSLRRFIAIRGPVRILRSDRGSNFVGAADSINASVIDVENPSFKNYLNDNGITWYFNAPHASHMGGVWERAIGVARRILDSMLLNTSHTNLTHEVLCTFMAEVTAVMNSRPLVTMDTDATDPLVLSPNILLTQKQGEVPTISDNLNVKDSYRAQWKHVQVLSDMFWKRWRDGYINQLQPRRKWASERTNLKEGDVVLVHDKASHRNDWPIAIVEQAIESDDKLVRKAVIRYLKDGKMVKYTRPTSELVLLLSE